MTTVRRKIKRGEALAIMAEAVHSGPEASFWDCFSSAPKNEREDDVAVVHIRGALDHHDGWGDCYESILDRVSAALSGEDVVAEATHRSYYDDAVHVPPACAPKAVVLRIDSPGGVVSGLNQTVFALRKMAAAAGIPLVAYVDELAASAAYALACACDEIILPPSAVVGSIGVISMMYDQTEADKEMGVAFHVITSGARKADGNPHVPTTAGALSGEQKRVDRLARQFYDVVAEARPLSRKDIDGLEAGIFLGQEGVDKGLADAVMTWADVVEALNNSGTVKQKDIDAPRQRASKSITVEPVPPPNEGPAGKVEKNMSLVALTALVTRTEKAIASEKDPKKKATLSANLVTYQAAQAAYKKEKHKVETSEVEESDEPEEEMDESDDADAESAAASDDSDDSDDDDKDEPEDKKQKKAASALLDLVQKSTGKRGLAAVGALSAMLAQGSRDSERINKIEKERKAEQKTGAIAAALAGLRITKAEAKELATQPLSFVTPYLSMRTKKIVFTDDDAHVPGAGSKLTPAGELPADVMASIESAVKMSPDGMDKATLKTSMIEAHKTRLAAASNGAGRY